MAALRNGTSAAGPTGTGRPAARAGACAWIGASRSSSVSPNKGVTTVLAFLPSGVGCHGGPPQLGLELAKKILTINRRKQGGNIFDDLPLKEHYY